MIRAGLIRSRTCALLAAAGVVCLMPAAAALAQDSAKSTLSRDDARKLKNPVHYSKKSIDAGRAQFRRSCTECHGPDGKAMVDVVHSFKPSPERLPKGERDTSER